MIAATRSFVLGQFTVIQRPRPDNAAWAVYIIYRDGKIVGKSFSVPDEGCCQWLEQQELNRIRYAQETEQKKFCMRNWSLGRRGRPTKAEQERRAMLTQIEDID